MTADGFETRAIHAGQEPDPATGAVIVPIYATSTYAQDGVGGLRGGYEYSRTGNPTRTALETCLADLEGGARGLAFGSGLAATDALARAVLRPGDEVILPSDAYGGTYRLFARVLQDWGAVVTPVPQADLDAVRAAVSDRTRLVWVETPTNPLLTVVDIASVVEIAHAAGALVAVDNTFATPYLQRPLEHGADAVVHSMTKYLGGHSDVVGGAVVTADAGLAEQVAFLQNAVGAVCSPFDAWLVLRGLKTLGIRMDRHCRNAEAVATALAEHPAVTHVLHPGRPEHPNAEVAARQMRAHGEPAGGGMVSFRVRGGADAARAVAGAFRVFTLAESLGGVESLVEYPASMTHASVAGSPLEVPDDLVRLSVGIETEADLVADVLGALAALD